MHWERMKWKYILVGREMNCQELCRWMKKMALSPKYWVHCEDGLLPILSSPLLTSGCCCPIFIVPSIMFKALHVNLHCSYMFDRTNVSHSFEFISFVSLGTFPVKTFEIWINLFSYPERRCLLNTSVQGKKPYGSMFCLYTVQSSSHSVLPYLICWLLYSAFFSI